MKNYDFAKAKQLIEANKDEIKTASLGMHEDWFWTADTVFENGNYTVNLEAEKILIGGIGGSSWATPALNIEYLDGTERMIPCYVGESSEQVPGIFGKGIFSAPRQETIVPLEKEDTK